MLLAKSKRIWMMKMDERLPLEVIEPAKSECSLPIVFPTEKDGSLQISVHYKNLNTVSGKNVY